MSESVSTSANMIGDVLRVLGDGQAQPLAKIREAASGAGVSDSAINRCVVRMVGLGLLERPRRGWYQLSEAGRDRARQASDSSILNDSLPRSGDGSTVPPEIFPSAPAVKAPGPPAPPAFPRPRTASGIPDMSPPSQEFRADRAADTIDTELGPTPSRSLDSDESPVGAEPGDMADQAPWVVLALPWLWMIATGIVLLLSPLYVAAAASAIIAASVVVVWMQVKRRSGSRLLTSGTADVGADVNDERENQYDPAKALN